MIVTPLEEWDSAKWKKYQKDISELVGEFETWAKRLQEKALAKLTPEQRENMMHRISDDGSFVVSMDIEKLLGKK